MLPEKFAILHPNLFKEDFSKWEDYIEYLNKKLKSHLWENLEGNYYTNFGQIFILSKLPTDYTILTLEQFFKMKNEQEFTPEYGKEYLFSDYPITNKNEKYEGVYKGFYIGKTLFRNKFIVESKSGDICILKYCTPIPTIKEVTLEEVAEKFGVKEIKIIQ